MSKINRFSLEERDNYQNHKVIYDKDADNDIELNNIYPIIDLLNKLDKQITELKKQLGEKEKTIQDLIKAQEFLERSCSYQMLLDTQKENILLKQQLKQVQNKKAIEELEGLQVQCQFSITFADYTQEQRLYDYINDRIKELKGSDVHA